MWKLWLWTVLLFSLIVKSSTLVENATTNDYEKNRRMLLNSPSPIYKRFESTVKSCLGSHCMNELFANNLGEKITRIGVLSPHTKDWSGLLQCISKIESKLRKDNTMEISTHVPPYGYGRNHGWSKIIRIIDNILDDSYRLLVPYNNNSEVFEQLFEIQVIVQR
jgi:hypothetical protein